MVGQIGHREVAGASCRACAESAPQRASTARKCTVRTTLAPPIIGLGSFARWPVWTRRASHPAPAGRPPRGGAKVTWFGDSCECRRYSRDDPRELITWRRRRRAVAARARVAAYTERRTLETVAAVAASAAREPPRACALGRFSRFSPGRLLQAAAEEGWAAADPVGKRRPQHTDSEHVRRVPVEPVGCSQARRALCFLCAAPDCSERPV